MGTCKWRVSRSLEVEVLWREQRKSFPGKACGAGYARTLLWVRGRLIDF